METLRPRPRQPVEDEVENWDDDDFLIEGDDLALRTSSSTTNVPAHRRDSQSSHFSMRSERESLHAEEEKQVHLPGDDEKSTLDAIAVAASAGIPIPRNVPPSALMGGTIKRLGGRKVKKILQEDWGDDLELPDGAQGLRIKPQDASNFPEVLRQVSSTQPSPSKPLKPPPSMLPPAEPSAATSLRGLGLPINLDKFRDTEDDDDDDFFGDGSATIKVSKTPQAPKMSLITAPAPQPKKEGDDDFENDFELPSDGKLKLSSRKDIPKTPTLSSMDDFDWGEGSLGTRFGGTRRDGRSNRSSSASAFSPSVSSSMTAESEDEAQLDGLVIPVGPVNFQERLQKRSHRQSRSPERIIEEEPSLPPPPKSVPQAEPDKGDFFAGLDIGDGSAFDTGKLTLHRNIKVKEARPTSPTRPKAAVSLTFTNKPVQPASRLPRPTTSHHERSHTQSSLEPVSESGGPIVSRLAKRSQSRLGHFSQSSQSSITSIHTPTTPSAPGFPSGPSTPRRREVAQKSSTVSLRDGPLRDAPTTTSAQLLRLKRSLPVMRPPGSPVRPMTARGFERPPSRTDTASRPQSALRPKTPVDRGRHSLGGTESAAAQARKPFLPGGVSASQSHNVNAKFARTFRRHNSDYPVDLRPSSRAVSRSTVRSPSPVKRDRNLERLARAGPRQTFNLPPRSKHFGDGHELDAFDDLPTSARAEAEFVKLPKSTSNFRNKVMMNLLPPRMNSPAPPSPYYPARFDHVPHFARDTASSRMTREANMAQRAPSTGPLAPLTAQRVAQLSTRGNYHPPAPPQATIRSKKPFRKPQLKPHLISNLNSSKESKMVDGMFYNADTYRWEGNDGVLGAFEPPASSPSTASMPPFAIREKENATPRPALITNISSTKNVQIVGEMVFDPYNMTWLKRPHTAKADMNDPMDGFNALEDEDEDPFKDIPDLEDNTADTTESGRTSEVKDDWLVGEEFDVGPEFIKRQREEEDRWRKKCEKWLGAGQRDRDAWRWSIRSIVTEAVD